MVILKDVVPGSIVNIANIPEDVLNIPVRLGAYQLAFLWGDQLPSGADLKGNARKYGAHYKRARAAALDKVNTLLDDNDTGVTLNVERFAHGRLALVWRVAGWTLAEYRRAERNVGYAALVHALDANGSAT